MIILDLLKELYSNLYTTLKIYYIIPVILLIFISPIHFQYRIIFLTCILILYFYKYKIKYHSKFWINQPLSNNKNGLILNTNDDKNELVDINNIPHETNLNKLIPFWNKYFNNDINITKKQFKNTKFITIKNNKILGTLAYTPCQLKMPNKQLHSCYYIDYFCIIPELRKSKNNLAYTLMNYLKQIWKHNKINMMVFKLDDTNKLPFGNPVSFYYYYINIDKIINHTIYDNIPIIELHRYKQKDYTIVKTIYDKLIFEKYKICQPFDDITKYKILYHKSKNNNDAIIIWRNIIRREDNKKCMEILYLLGNKISCLKSVLMQYKDKYKWDIVLILGLKEHKDIINVFEMTKGLKTKYYFYNYEIGNIDENEICLNIY